MRSNATGLESSGKLGVLLAIPGFPMLRAGFRSIIDKEPDMAVVADVDSSAVLDAIDRTGADVVIAECLPANAEACDSFELVQQVRAARPMVRIIAIDCRAATDQFSQALKAGADGFITREAAPDDVLSAVRSVCRGQTYVSPAIVSRMVNTYVLGGGIEKTPEDAYTTLSERERQVLLLAAVGHTNREIAGRLGLPEGRVHHYRATVMEKLGLHDRVELLKYAIRRGVLGVADV